MRGLAEAARRIGAIVQVIRGIAAQTNLLALNATIEAARAGDAGKSFAVVASEVKTLANQTTKATDEIQAQIVGIQNETARAADAIGAIDKTVSDMRGTTAGIAAAMEQQGATTQEIARNINQAAERIGQVSSNLGSIAETAETTSDAVVALHGASESLRHEAEGLDRETARFFDQIRAA
jgi:methyl-accepting chemotaxis protein